MLELSDNYLQLLTTTGNDLKQVERNVFKTVKKVGGVFTRR